MIEVRELHKSYGAFRALVGVNASVPEGAVGLLGPNGAGKSTLIKTLLGLLDFTEGSAAVLGVDVREDARRVRAQVGYMPESEAFFPGFTAQEMVVYAGRLSGLPESAARQRAAVLLDYVLMGEERYRPVASLSTGMKQKVKLAQALVHGPRLVFLDEPTNGLDPMGREEMLSIVEELPRHGVSVVLSSHLLRDVERVCETLVLMDQGEVLHVGPIAAFADEGAGRWELRVRGDAPTFAAALQAGGFPTEARADGLLLAEVPGGADPAGLWRVALETGTQVRHIQRHRPNLQDAFVRFIQDCRTAATGPTSEAP